MPTKHEDGYGWFETCSTITYCERADCNVWTNASTRARRGYWGTVEIDGVKHTVCERRCAELLRQEYAKKDSLHHKVLAGRKQPNKTKDSEDQLRLLRPSD